MRFAENPPAPTFVGEPFTRAGVQYPSGWLANAWAQEPELVTALGIGPVTEAGPAPEGQSIVSDELRHGEGGFYIEAVYAAPPPPTKAALVALVNADRDARIEGGFVFEGRPYQTRQSDRENIVRKGDRAQRAIDFASAEAGDLFWDATLPEGQPFIFLAGDNSVVPMDAQTMVALRDAGEAFKQTCVFIARAAKDAIEAAADDAAAKAIYDAVTWPPSEPAAP